MKHNASVLLVAALALGFTAVASALEPVNSTLFGDLAIKGYDPVAYFAESKPVKGSAKHTFAYMGATWRFANAENLAAFKADPAKYAPQYGGYCAWAVSQNYTADIDPNAWRIVNEKLYLNYDKSVQAEWEKDIPGLIAKANTNWPALLEKK